MKLKYLLKRSLNIKTTYIIVIVLALILVVGGYFSYALFTTSSESKGALNIVTGNLYSLIESNDLDSNKSVILTPGDDRVITLHLKNVNGINSKHNLYYEASSNNIKVGYTEDGDTPPTNTGYVLTRSGQSGDTKTIKVRIKNKDSSNVTITFGSDAGLPNATLAFPQGKSVLTLYTPEYDPVKLQEKNPNILAVYRYNENGTGTGTAYTGCLGGEEAGCTDIISEVNGSTTYTAGDIIKYKVNDNEEKYFNVLYDNTEDGTLTLQQRENTVYSTPWCSKEDYIAAGGTEEDYGTTGKNDKGPITILNALETATAGWTNVNNQTYTAGETVFGTGDFATNKTACNLTEGSIPNATQCNDKTYADFTRTNVKARMITAQETGEMGCVMWKSDDSSNMSCKKFMNNYLYKATSYGGTIEDDYHTEGDHNYGYWTMSGSTYRNDFAYDVRYLGQTNNNFVYTTQVGNARAVVNINKNNRVEL